MWLSQVARGDLGRTLLARQSVAKVIRQKVFNTFQLAFAGWLLV
ncbi:MAG: hypothetical protein QF467_04355 [SAR202 cluster bacterium]|nr:hypothetical protein [SAR202 cluster bacterium]